MLKSISDVKAELAARGIGISEWAEEHGFPAELVYKVVSGKRKGMRGQSHNIAVALGLKTGQFNKSYKGKIM